MNLPLLNSLKFAVILLILLILIITINYFQKQPTSNSLFSSAQLQSSLQKDLAHKPISTVYAEIKEKYRSANDETQHDAAHIFGEQIYKSHGLEAITVCDETMGYGCFHGVFAMAIQDKGTTIINQLNQKCLDKYGTKGTPCQHGIGHGIFEVMGAKQINEGLQLCENIQTNPLLGCSSGFFMELNFPQNSRSFEQINVRDIKNNYHSPCNSVPAKFSPSCYFELTDLWFVTFKENDTQTKLLCNDVVEEKSRSACFKGLGKSKSIFSNYSVHDVELFCQSLADKDRLACLAGARWGFYSNLAYTNRADTLCQSSSDVKQCILEGDLRNEK